MEKFKFELNRYDSNGIIETTKKIPSCLTGRRRRRRRSTPPPMRPVYAVTGFIIKALAFLVVIGAVTSTVSCIKLAKNSHLTHRPLEYVEEAYEAPLASIQMNEDDMMGPSATQQMRSHKQPTIYLTHTHEEVGDDDVEILTSERELFGDEVVLEQQNQHQNQHQQHVTTIPNGALISNANALNSITNNNNNNHHQQQQQQQHQHEQHQHQHQHQRQHLASVDFIQLRNLKRDHEERRERFHNEKRSNHQNDAKHRSHHHQHHHSQHHHHHQQHKMKPLNSEHYQNGRQKQQNLAKYEYHHSNHMEHSGLSEANQHQTIQFNYSDNHSISSINNNDNDNRNIINNNKERSSLMDRIVTLADISPEVPKRIYHSKFTIDDLLTKTFQHQISNDIDMDPCKAGGFMGDIALPDIKYDDNYPIVAFTRPDDMEQSDAADIDRMDGKKFNDTFQKEIEILKQEVYHEGLQVEEEGLTDIMRRKTKIPNSKYDSNNDFINSANELIKPNYNFELSKNPNTNEVLSVDSNENHALKNEKFHFPILMNGNSKHHGTDESDEKMINKSSIGLGNRNVDHRKIQSNTKDIELDASNNFVSERKFVIVPTAPPIQRTTLPNVYSNAGGNGMQLDEIQEFKGSSTIVKKRHRRGRKNRPASNTNQKNADYQYKLQQLREELNRPVDRFSRITNQHNKYSSQQPQSHHNHHNHHHHHQHQHHHHHHNYRMRPKYSSPENYQSDLLVGGNPSKQHNHSYPQSIYQIPDDNNHFNVMNDEHRRLPRALTAKKERIWDYGVIPYEIDGNFSGLHKALFKQAMRHWENFTCIKFVERDPELHPNYIVFTIRGCGCCSFVGKRGNGPQAISIGRNCDKFGIVVHELGHVVGFWHEHTRPDREKHVVIEPNNIMKGQEYNFNKLTPDEVNSLGMPYDYDSIMHYARNTFSKGTYLDTILPVEVKGKKRPEIGQRLRLSSGDIAQANLLYKCPKCGRTFQDDNGFFTSPSFYMIGGTLPNDTEHCEWRISATHGERVILRLENLNIFKSENCQTDYLEIRDGYYNKSPLIARYCGKISHEILTTESSRMLLTYVNKHRTEGFRGFKAEFDVICGGEIIIDDNESRLESPNYPLDYLPKKECVWKITAPKGYQVALKFQSFEVENHDSCVYDFVEVRDGPNQNSPLIGVFCGYKPPPNMKSTGDTMFVKFVSDTSVQKPGFSATFMKEVDECEMQNHGCEHECINTLGGYECGCHIGYELHSDKKHCEDACGGVIEYPNGTITSPSFPDKYPMLKDCIWEIIAPPKYKISLNFTHFDLEGAAHHQSECGYDKVTIYSKLSESRLKRIGTYCGSTIPPTATSEGNALRIEFHSDKSIQTTGFAAVFFTDVDECSVNNGGCQHECRNTIGSYMCSCHNGYSLHENGHDCKEGECKHEISAPFGTIYSPNYPDLYPPNADCVWHFSTTPGHRIKLIFNEFKLESHQECSYDNIIIYDGDSENSSMLGRFCGDKIPYPISSSTNQLYMVLKTDKNKQHSGFTAVHSTSCGGYLRATPQIQQFYSHSRYGNHDYDRNMDCEWLIQAPLSSNVQLIFLTFDLETSDNCTYDYVQVFSGMEDTSGPMYGQFCGNTLPQDIISLTDSLLIRFKTDDSITMKGFSASYVAVDPFENSEEDEDEDLLIYSSEMVTPFPGSLKSIYKEEDNSQETDDYNDFNENRLVVNNNPYYMNRYLMTFGREN